MWEHYEYVPVAQKKAAAQKAFEKLKKKNPDIEPIIVSGNKVVKTWWGIAWTKNLESYADYSNRIGRGRSYVKNGFVLDLKIDVGTVTALVQGSRGKPYKVEITVAPVSQENRDEIAARCSHKIDSIAELASGQFPKELAEYFTTKNSGLFPSPKEINLDCSCPDWAHMCKHVAAVLYGIGARFDNDPLLFFKLRNIDVDALIKKSVEEKMSSMLHNADSKTDRVMDDVDISDLFGI